MPYTPEQRRAHRQTCTKDGCWCKRKGPNSKSGKHKPTVRPIITIDGEALGDSGYHLLAASTGEEIANTTDGLSSADCLRFLLELQAKHGTAIYCGYALGYDCEHWIRDFGPKLWKQLAESGEGTITLDGYKWVLQYIPRKWFKLGFYNKADRFITKVQVFDVFTFFQASFIATVGSPETGQKKGWGAATADEMKVLLEWKAKRGEFAIEDWQAIREYNQIECRVLVRLMSKLRDALESADIHLSSWHGPGAVANALLRKYGMKEHIATPPAEVEDAIARAYFGGRFQVFRYGHIDKVYDYDISSAYPFATSLLPSSCGRWEQVSEYQGDENPWTVYLCSWDIDAGGAELTPFPWRTTRGLIHYPSYGRGWYWGWEVAAARRAFGDEIVIEAGWRLHTEQEGVFGWMNDLASKRVEAKQNAKTATGEEREKWQGIERAYKLALNSVYGKTIQTVGSHKPFLCPMWAGLITAHTRSRLMDAARLQPRNLVCFATDGLFANAPNAGVSLGSDLGDWELAGEGLTLELYQSGCYRLSRDQETVDSKFRGITRDGVPWAELAALWRNRHKPKKEMSIPCKRFIGHRTALQRGKPELQCTWDDTPKEISLHPGSGWPNTPVDKTITFGKYEWPWETMIYENDYNEVSARYRKLPPGETDFENDEMAVQP